MKKISVFLMTAVLIMSFTACSGAKKADAPAEEPVKVEEVVEEVIEAIEVPQLEASTVKPAEALKNFQDFAKEYAEAFNNIAKDPKKFSDLAAKSTQIITDIAAVAGEFDKKQLEEYQKAAEIIAKVNTGGK